MTSQHPYVRVRQTGDKVEVSGQPECSLGHRLPRVDNAPPDGVFAHWKWDGTRLTASTDRYGLHPLYYFATDDSVAISTSVEALLKAGAPLELDDAAVAVFLRIGFFVGQDTPFRAIRAMPPNARLEWKQGNLDVTATEVVPRAMSCSRESAVDQYIELFRAAIRHRKPPGGKVIVPLSGGQDSRHILFELCESGMPPDLCVTVRRGDLGECQETATAALVAEACGVPHVVIRGDTWSIGGEARKNALSNYCSDEHLWMLPLADYLGRHADSVYDGIGGDVLSAGHRLDPQQLALYEKRHLGDLAALMTAKQEPLLESLLSDNTRKRFGRDLATTRLEIEMARHENAVNPLTAFTFWNRTRREIALGPYALMSGVQTVFAPYLDHDLFDFLISLPPSFTIKKDFHAQAIAKAYPRWADLPYATKKVKLRYSLRALRRSSTDIFRLIRATQAFDIFRSGPLCGRLLRCLVDPTYSWNALWLGRTAVYFVQIMRHDDPGRNAVPESSHPAILDSEHQV